MILIDNYFKKDMEYISEIDQEKVKKSVSYEDNKSHKYKNEILKYISSFSETNFELCNLIEELFYEVSKNPNYLTKETFSSLIDERNYNRKQKLLRDFSEKRSVAEEQVEYYIEKYNPNLEENKNQIDLDALRNSAIYDKYKENPDNKLKKLVYRPTIEKN